MSTTVYCVAVISRSNFFVFREFTRRSNRKKSERVEVEDNKLELWDFMIVLRFKMLMT